MRLLRWRIRTLALVVCALGGLRTDAVAFPPYRSTDADTAEPGKLEVRLGLLRVEREDDDNAYSSPLLRTNLGLPKKLELITEFEFRADEGRFGDGAAGLKWAPVGAPGALDSKRSLSFPCPRSTVEVVSSHSFSPPFVERTSVFTSTPEAFTTRARTIPSTAGERAPSVSLK